MAVGPANRDKQIVLDTSHNASNTRKTRAQHALDVVAITICQALL